MTNEELLGEIEDILRNVPSQETIREHSPKNFSWFGRVSAVLSQWDSVKGAFIELPMDQIHEPMARTSSKGFRKVLVILYEARHDLIMKTTGPMSVSVSKDMVFDYFDGIRKIIELANQDVLFIDPYLNAEFVSRYLPNIKTGVAIRLLVCKKKLGSLLPAVEAYRVQKQQSIEVRSAEELHDRFIFIDGISCHQSGASFKDGAKNSPTTITQITDAFQAMKSTYEKIWKNAHVET